MGYYLNIEGYKKVADCIIGHMPVLDIYEVNRTKIKKHAIKDTTCMIRRGLSTINYVLTHRHECRDFQVYDQDVLYHYLVPNGIVGTGSRMENGEMFEVMFGPTKIKESMEKYLRIAQYFENRSYNPIEKGEIEIIKLVINILEKIESEDGLLSMTLG